MRAEAVVAGREGALGVLAVVDKVFHGGLLLLADGGPDGGVGLRVCAAVEAARVVGGPRLLLLHRPRDVGRGGRHLGQDGQI